MPERFRIRSGISSLQMRAVRLCQKKQYPARVIIHWTHTRNAARRSSLPSLWEIMFSLFPGSLTVITDTIVIIISSILLYPRKGNKLLPCYPRAISTLFPIKYGIRTSCFHPITNLLPTTLATAVVLLLLFCRAKPSMNEHPHRHGKGIRDFLPLWL